MRFLISTAQLWLVVSIIITAVAAVVSIVLRLVVLSMLMMLMMPAAAFVIISTISTSIVHILAALGRRIAAFFCGHHDILVVKQKAKWYGNGKKQSIGLFLESRVER